MFSCPGGTDYTYDLNGNMISYWNKEIDQITYNHLNLPKRIIFKVDSGDKFIAYIYNDALGQKCLIKKSGYGRQEDIPN